MSANGSCCPKKSCLVSGVSITFLFLIKKLDEDLHQKIAQEMNLSETAFIRKLNPTDNFTQSKYAFIFLPC